MKHTITFFCLLLVLLAGCRKKATESFTSSGTLGGWDLALCPCCGGIFLETDDAKKYRIESLPGLPPQELGNLVFPKKIKYNWVADRECGGIVYIKITSYKFE
jgi:hypothetical protein